MKVKNIQSLVCLVFFILFANQVWAVEWVLYEKSSTGDEYYDKNSIKEVKNNIVRVWTKKIYNDAGKIKKYSVLKDMDKAPVNPYLLSHEVTTVEIDCLNQKVKVSSERVCDKRGGIIASDLQFPNKWKNIILKSSTEKLKNQVCAPSKYSKIKKP